MADEDELIEIQNADSWDLALRYHDYKTQRSLKDQLPELRSLSVAAILERARAIIGAVVHPQEVRSVPLSDVPPGQSYELDIETTLENSPLEVAQIQSDQDAEFSSGAIWVEYPEKRQQPVVLSVDTSLSMTGDKLALTAVALAVVLLQFPEDPIGMIAFENDARVLKHPLERIGVEELVARFLDVPARGYTHIEAGTRQALHLVEEVRERQRGRSPAAVLLTDGKYTAGRDPAYLAPRFPQLSVLKMGLEKGGAELCEEMAHLGRGSYREVADLSDLPSVMYGLVKDLLRGR